MSLPPSIEKQITDRLIARLTGDDDLPLPSGLPAFTIDKDRRVLSVPGAPRLSVYALKQNEPDRVGNLRTPIMLTRTLLLEARVLLQGDDDALDPFRQWITQCLATAGKLVNDGVPEGLTLSARESESMTDLAQDSSGKVLMWLSRWTVEFTTLPADLTVTGRAISS